MPTSPSLSQAAQAVIDAEIAALQGVLNAVNQFDAALTAVLSTLDYPPEYPSNAKRIVGELKQNLMWRQTDLPNQLAQLRGEPPAGVTPIAPTP